MDYPSNTYPMHTVFAVNAHYALLLFMLGFCELHAQDMQQFADPLSFTFDKHYGQIEVGGRYAGAEFHRSRPLPSRISFYYPVANSIDLSTDYWKRDASRPMTIGVKVDGSQRRSIGNEPWTYTVAPHRVVFERMQGPFRYMISYEFCLSEPAMVMSLKVTNIAG